jgi:phosphoribosylformylglycinamidine synthase subunit PurL
LEITPGILKDHGLTLEEYETIKKHLKREPNINEVGMYSVLWSEHCSYKNSKVLLKKFPSKGKRVLLGPGENAGVIDLGDGVGLSFKIESHNHPSAIEPYQGAATGIGGIIRDIFAMGARPIACLNSLRFGEINTDSSSRHLFEYVVKGIGDYGNCVGVPTVAGEVYFEEPYSDNCLVNAMCVGVVQASDKSINGLYGRMINGVAKGEGNPIFYVGSSTGRDGIHGATFASVELSDESTENKSSVQVGDPFQEKLLIEACLELLKHDFVVGMGDMGAAGLTSSLSEMASRGNHGVEIDVSLVPQREKKMTPYEILLSESQERMVVVIEKGKEEEALKIIKKWDLHGVVIGKVTNDNMFRVLENNKIVAEVPAKSLTDDAPVYIRESKRPDYLETTSKFDISNIQDITSHNTLDIFKKILSSPNIASKKWVYEQYDYMVQTNTFIAPAEADAAVLYLKGTDKRIAVKTDGNGRYCYLNPYKGGKITVAESARNVVCTGARPVAITNCLNFGNPEKKDSFYQLEKAVEGMAEACNVFSTPVISGNVSLYNESEKRRIYPTPVVGMVGLFDDNVEPMTLNFKNIGDILYLIGESKNEIGGTEYLKIIHGLISGDCPDIDLSLELQLHNIILLAIENKLVSSVHDIADGGLLVALYESVSKSDFGIEANILGNGIRNDAIFFGETQSRYIVSISEENKSAFEKLLRNTTYQLIGKTIKEKNIRVKINNNLFLDSKIDVLNNLYFDTIKNLMKID